MTRAIVAFWVIGGALVGAQQAPGFEAVSIRRNPGNALFASGIL